MRKHSSLALFVLPPIAYNFVAAFQSHRLTPDFPEALFELLCTLQEGRRLNDQRCSFRLESGVIRRRCHSEPNTNKPANRGGGPLRTAAAAILYSSLTHPPCLSKMCPPQSFSHP